MPTLGPIEIKNHIIVLFFMFLPTHRFQNFYRLKIEPLLAEIRPVLYRKVKFYIIAMKTNTQSLSVYFFLDLPTGNHGNRKKMLVLVIYFILFFRLTDFTKRFEKNPPSNESAERGLSLNGIKSLHNMPNGLISMPCCL